MTESPEISIHQARIYAALRDAGPDHWITARDIVATAHVALRTARLHAKRLVDLQIVEEAAVFPRFRYRLRPAEELSKRNLAYVQRLEHALGVFGLNTTAKRK